ncbi:hypothetical protein PHMEG_00028490 [Phytophthora megakarya]|uniref:Uncharacterized protein n=1 Tax=Phytophthora megakarya TaxID=4795 RepID=A0A225V5V1_9STRA|nr:hypothetical protein PHMEG_00028490 [Phytophthora megakarya]
MRSSLFYLFRTYNVSLPDEFDSELKVVFGRKGSSTYVSSCCTGEPSSLVSGSPYETPEFAILPPCFEPIDETVWNSVNICFPGVSDRLKKVCSYLLVSLVFHFYHLTETLDRNHVF